MQVIVLDSPSKSKYKLLMGMAKELGCNPKELTDEEIEDLGLYRAMQEGKKGGYVSRDVVMKTLKGNAGKV
jgi:hypothetical protein